jgi:hypothetical protein
MMAEGRRAPILPLLSMMVLAAAAGFWLGHYQTIRQKWPFQGPTPQQKTPNQTSPSEGPAPPSPDCGRPTSHPVAGSLLKGVTLEGDGMLLPSPHWLLHVGPAPHTLKVTNTGTTAIQLGMVQLYDNVDDKYQLSDSLPANCNFPMLTNPGCNSLAASGGSCTFTLNNIDKAMTIYIWISIATGGGIEVSIPIVP